MVVFCYQIKTPICFVCKQRLNPRFLIQPLENNIESWMVKKLSTLPYLMRWTHITLYFNISILIDKQNHTFFYRIEISKDTQTSF